LVQLSRVRKKGGLWHWRQTDETKVPGRVLRRINLACRQSGGNPIGQTSVVKVIHIVENLDLGAVENWLVRMLRHARAAGIGVDWTFYCIEQNASLFACSENATPKCFRPDVGLFADCAAAPSAQKDFTSRLSRTEASSAVARKRNRR
jgi:hypothetical protein